MGVGEPARAVKAIVGLAGRADARRPVAPQLPSRGRAVVGGGAGGVELALSAQHRLARLSAGTVEVTLVTREALLPSHNRRVRRYFERIFGERGIALLTHQEIVRVEPGKLICADGRGVAFDKALWVTEAGGAMLAHPREKAGVYAVGQGPPLAANLRRGLTGKRPRR